MNQSLLRSPMDICQRAFVERDAILAGDDGEAGRPVMKQANFQHI
jgi:hypothetical protein